MSDKTDQINQALKNWRDQINSTPALQDEIKSSGLQTPESFLSLGKQHGHDFTIEDMKFAYGAMKDSEVELTPFELECMVGGKGEKALAASGEVAAELGNDMLADMF